MLSSFTYNFKKGWVKKAWTSSWTFHELVHLHVTLNITYFYNFAFFWSFSPCSSLKIDKLCYLCIIHLFLCVYDLSASLHPFFFCIESIVIIYVYFRFYPLNVLNRSSFYNMLPYLSLTLSYRMNVNDVLYWVITIYTA